MEDQLSKIQIHSDDDPTLLRRDPDYLCITHSRIGISDKKHIIPSLPECCCNHVARVQIDQKSASQCHPR
jgi:hypothetical protein